MKNVSLRQITIRFLPLAYCLFASVFASAAESARRPNVLFIISDDLSSRITPAGWAGRQTAVLDRLAAVAVTFRSVFQEHFGMLPGEYASKAHAGGIRQE